jgi:hypothetical protein
MDRADDQGRSKGERYARIFRKAGTYLGKGNIARAVETLKEGRALAERLGDRAMMRRFEEAIVHAQKSAQSSGK